MKRKTEQQKALERFLVGVGYGSLLGLFLGLITGNIAVAMVGAGAGAAAMVGAGALVRVRPVVGTVALAMAFAVIVVGAGAMGAKPMTLDMAWAMILDGVEPEPVTKVWVQIVFGAWSVATAMTLALEKIAKNKTTSPEELIDEHIDWLVSLFQKFRLFIKNRNHAETSASSHVRKRAWDVQLIVSFVHELAAVFPEEWNEWQHWISDMMDSRTRMQSKGMNHRLVSLLTFYRLTRFVWHIGIAKVFILATHRATR